MGNFFVNKDGTIKVLRATIAVMLVLFVAIFIMAILMGSKDDLTVGGGTTTTQKIETTTIDLCRDCEMEFTQKSVTLNVDDSIDLKEIMKLEKVNIRNVKLSIEDTSLLEITASGDTLLLSSKDKIGTTNVTATYEGLESTLKVSVQSDEIRGAAFSQDIYYVYFGETSSLDITTEPEGMDVSLLDLAIDNTDIAEVNSQNAIIGKNIGETTIRLNCNNTTDVATLYVVKNRIEIKVKNDNLYEAMENYKYQSNYAGGIDISISFEDRDNQGYTNEDLKFDVINAGSMNASVNYDGKNISSDNLYNYHIAINVDMSKEALENYSIIEVSLPDGSKTRLRIEK